MTTNPIQNDIARRFDHAAADWDQNPTRVALATAVASAIQRTVPLQAEMQAMDFGAGTGLLTLAIAPQVAAILAVDVSRKMLHVMESKLAELDIHNVETLCADIAHDHLPAAGFDLVVSSMALHHVKDVRAAVLKLGGCLRPGGRIALADLDTEDGTFHEDSSGVYHNGIDRSELCAWLMAGGFTDVTSCEVHRITKNGREYSVFLVTGRIA